MKKLKKHIAIVETKFGGVPYELLGDVIHQLSINQVSPFKDSPATINLIEELSVWLPEFLKKNNYPTPALVYHGSIAPNSTVEYNAVIMFWDFQTDVYEVKKIGEPTRKGLLYGGFNMSIRTNKTIYFKSSLNLLDMPKNSTGNIKKLAGGLWEEIPFNDAETEIVKVLGPFIELIPDFWT